MIEIYPDSEPEHICRGFAENYAWWWYMGHEYLGVRSEFYGDLADALAGENNQ